jgi:hypothetical protein
MTFLQPELLWVLPFALAPIVIYYLMRYRSLRVTWGSNYILERALARFQKKVYLEQLLLLVLRTLVAIAIVLAFARPASKQKSAGTANAGIHHIMLVDASASMQAGESGQTRWDRAIEVMTRYSASWGRGERWSVCVVGAKPVWQVDGETQMDPARTKAILSGLTPGQGAVSWAQTLPLIRDKLSAPGVELLVVSDDQALTWAGLEKAVTPGPGSLSGYWVNTARADYENSAVMQARFGSSLAVVGQPCRLYVDLRHFGTEPVEGMPLEILRDGASYARETVALLPNQSRTLPVDVIFDEPGSHFVTVRLGKDMLAVDNSASAGIDVRSALKVVVLRDKGKSGKLDSAWPLLDLSARAWRGEAGKGKVAGDAQATAQEAAPLVSSFKEGDIKAEDLNGADVVVLDGSRTLTPELGAMLREVVSAGGSLVLAPDGMTDLQAWNRILAECRLLPAPLSRFRTERLAGERFQTLTRSDWAPSAMRAFETEEDGDIGNIRFYSWVEFGKPYSGAQVVKTFADRSPFLVRLDEAPGAVLLLAGGLNGSGGNLIAREFCLPYLIRLMTDAASAAVLPRVVGNGESANLVFQPPADFKGVAFQLDNREPAGVTPRRVKAGMMATAPVAAGTWGLGAFLVLKESGVDRVWVGVQGGREDSDLGPLTPEAKTRLATQYNLVEVADWPQLEEKLKAVRTGGEFHHWVILALLALLLGEMLLERRFI